MTVRQRKKKTPSTNRGGTKINYDGITFRSKLEVYCYKKLVENNIPTSYEGVTFELLPPFQSLQFNNKKIRNIKYTPDFIGENYIIEVKGLENERFPIVWKLFLYLMFQLDDKNLKIFKVHSQKEVDNMIKTLKENNV